METATEVADEMAAQVATQMAATVTQPSRRVRHDVTESAMGANGNAPRSLEHALPTGSSATRADGVCVLVTCVGKRETNHPLATSQFLPANPMRRERERHQSEPAAAQQPHNSRAIAAA